MTVEIIEIAGIFFIIMVLIAHIILTWNVKPENPTEQIIRETIESSFVAWEEHLGSLDAAACNRDCGKRRTPRTDQVKKLAKIGYKIIWKKEIEASEVIADTPLPKEEEDEEEEQLIIYCVGCLADNGNCGHQSGHTLGKCPRVQRIKRESAGTFVTEEGNLLSSDFSTDNPPEELPLCRRCHGYASCDKRDDTKIECTEFTELKGVTGLPTSFYEKISEENMNAAESVTDAGDDFSPGDIMKVDIDKDI